MTPEAEQRGRDRLVALIVLVVILAEIGTLAFVYFGLRYLGVFP